MLLRRNTPIAKLLLVLVAFAMGAVQMLGGSKRYLCECSGSPIIVETADCEGEHGVHFDEATGEAEESGARDAESAESHESGHPEGGKHHELLTKEVKGRTSVSAETQVPSPAVCASVRGAVDLLPVMEAPKLKWELFARGDPAQSVLVARTLVRLV